MVELEEESMGLGRYEMEVWEMRKEKRREEKMVREGSLVLFQQIGLMQLKNCKKGLDLECDR